MPLRGLQALFRGPGDLRGLLQRLAALRRHHTAGGWHLRLGCLEKYAAAGHRPEGHGAVGQVFGGWEADPQRLAPRFTDL